jgi:hypothetical protein
MKLYLNAVNNDGPTWNKKHYLLAAAKRMGWNWVEELPKDVEPEYVLNIEPYTNFTTGTKWTGLWEIDMVLDRPELNKSDWVAADDVFVANTAIPMHMNGHLHKTRLLFQAADPEIHRKIPDIEQEFDFVFAGTNGMAIYSQRQRLMAMLRASYSFCDGGKGHSPQDYIKHLNRARVQFIRSGNTQVAESWTAQRFFECLAIGPVLVDWTPDLAKTGLIEGVDYFSYKTDIEMMAKFEKLITDRDFAEKMAASGRQKSLLYHTYDHRLISIINTMRNYGFTVPSTPL